MKNGELRSDKTGTMPEAPPAVLKRLPVYYRYLRSLISEDILRISSNELAARMHLTASQIRSDLSYFGGFGQQGYGYNVKYLFKSISDILGATKSYRAVMITTGEIGSKDISLSVFSERGIVFDAFFTVGETESDSEADSVTVPKEKIKTVSAIASFSHGETVITLPLSMLCEYCLKHDIDIVVVHSVGSEINAVTEALCKVKCHGIWNISGYDVVSGRSDIPVKNLYISDSLLSLCHSIKTEKAKAEGYGSDRSKSDTSEESTSEESTSDENTPEADTSAIINSGRKTK